MSSPLSTRGVPLPALRNQFGARRACELCPGLERSSPKVVVSFDPLLQERTTYLLLIKLLLQSLVSIHKLLVLVAKFPQSEVGVVCQPCFFLCPIYQTRIYDTRKGQNIPLQQQALHGAALFLP